jgi:hypothetical protein
VSFELPHIINELCAHQGVAVDQYSWREIIVVAGTGGTRVDAVAAWLNDQSSLTGIQAPRWTIATHSGKTNSAVYTHWFFERFHRGKNYDEDLYWLQHTYRPDGKILIQRHHDIDQLDPLLWNNIRSHVRYIHIEPSDRRELSIKQVWEFIAKSILQLPLRPEYGDFNRDMVLTRARRMFWNHLQRNNKFSVPVKVINYEDVVSERGSYRLAELLEIEISNHQHKIWAKGVTAGHSPDSVDFLGESWHLHEIEAVYDLVIREYTSRQFLTTG